MSSDDSASVVSKKLYSVLQDRKTYWYTVNEIKKAATCPSCGRSVDKFKNLTAHVKRCFSIKKIGPIYRLHGYVECKCGLLIADNTKAQKLHVCMGEVPAFEPDLSYVRIKPEPKSEPDPQPENRRAPEKRMSLSPQLDRKVLQPKPWIRNFVSPFKVDIENIQDKLKPEPRVRNFDMLPKHREPKNVSVYSIASNNGNIFVTDQTSKSHNHNTILIKKRALRLPSLKGVTAVQLFILGAEHLEMKDNNSAFF